MNRCTYAYLSLARHDPSGEDRPYLEWQQLEHMPEKYQFPGIVGAQRWVSTASCRRARLVEEDGWESVAHVTSYLMGDPIEGTMDDFLGVEAPRTGLAAERWASAPSLPIHFQAPLRLVATASASRTFLPPEVLPYRPNRGVFLVVEESTDPHNWFDPLHRDLEEGPLTEALNAPGVAGIWVFASPADLRPRAIVTPGHYRMSLYYLDDEPAEVAARLAGPLRDSWGEGPTRPVLAAPFESMLQLEWDRFGPGMDGP